MNDIAKTIVFLVVLVSDLLCSLSWAYTFRPLSCSTSSFSSCDAYIYLGNVTEPINSIASRFNISAQQITPFISAPDYLAKIQCSCLEFLAYEGFFYRVNYTVQSSDVGLSAGEIADKYFSKTALTNVQPSRHRAGDIVELALGCGCPIPGWQSIVSYSVPPGDVLMAITKKFVSNMSDIMRVNNIENPDVIMMDTVYFIPYLTAGRNATFPPNALSIARTAGRNPTSPPQPSLPPSTDTQENQHKSNNTRRNMKVYLPSAAAILLLLLSVISFYYGCYKRASSLQSSKATNKSEQSDYWVAHTSEIISLHETQKKKEHDEKLDEALSLTLLTNLTDDEIAQMKSYCTQCYEIGEGSFGEVYRGNLKDKDVAIKKLKCAGKDSKKLVENEVRLLQGMQHKNVASIVAWCVEEKTFYLVYEFVNGCTLDKYLRENSAELSLSWKNRLRMISRMAEGIEFLHLNNIIHVDIKPQNLMVNSKDGEVKLIDFGFSRHVDWEGTHRSTDRITGTRGYWAPEYCFNHNLSYKNDVYSFGIVVLEVITGQKHVDNARGSSQFHIPDYVRYMMAKNRFEEALDERLKGEGFSEGDLMNALIVANLALKCAEKDKEERPDMSDVTRVLKTMVKQNTEENFS